MQAVLVHGWKGWPENAWFPWLKRELEARGIPTQALKLRTPWLPRRGQWVKQVFASITDEHTALIGHSLGCAAILCALDLYDGPPIEKVVLVSGFGRPFLPSRLFKWNWFPCEIDFKKVKARAKSWVVIHAMDDRTVPFEEGEWLARNLQAEFIVLPHGRHFAHHQNAFEVPAILHAILT